jgi:hypothetical protein
MSDDYNPKTRFEYSLNAANAKEDFEKYDKAIDSLLENAFIGLESTTKLKIEYNPFFPNGPGNRQTFNIIPSGYLIQNKNSLISKITPTKKGVIEAVDPEQQIVLLFTPGYNFLISFGQEKK